MTEKNPDVDQFGTYHTKISYNHDGEVKNGTRVDPDGWLEVNGKPLRRTRFAKDWK